MLRHRLPRGRSRVRDREHPEARALDETAQTRGREREVVDHWISVPSARSDERAERAQKARPWAVEASVRNTEREQPAGDQHTVGLRSEKRRVGKECRSRWSPEQ